MGLSDYGLYQFRLRSESEKDYYYKLLSFRVFIVPNEIEKKLIDDGHNKNMAYNKSLAMSLIM